MCCFNWGGHSIFVWFFFAYLLNNQKLFGWWPAKTNPKNILRTYTADLLWCSKLPHSCSESKAHLQYLSLIPYSICPLSLCEDHQNSICVSAAKATDAEKMLVLPYIHFLGGENENCYPVRSVKDCPCWPLSYLEQMTCFQCPALRSTLFFWSWNT